MRKIMLALGLCFILGACNSPISGNVASDALPGGATGTLAQDFQAAAFNFDGAVKVGALDPTDPAPACAHAIDIMLGIEGTPPPNFTPENKGLISLAAIGYIRAQQLKKLQGQGLTVTPECKALIGQIVLDAAAGGIKGLPGGGLLPVFH